MKRREIEYQDVENTYSRAEEAHVQFSPLKMAGTVVFVLFLASLAATGIAYMLGAAHVYSKIRQELIQKHTVKHGELQTSTCRYMRGEMSDEEKKKYDLVHVVDNTYCYHAQGFVDEWWAVQIAEAMFGYYALCEPGKCMEKTIGYLYNLTVYGVMPSISTIGFVAMLLWVTGMWRPRSANAHTIIIDDSANVNALRQRLTRQKQLDYSMQQSHIDFSKQKVHVN